MPYQPVWRFFIGVKMNYIKICNWEKFQHYKKRNPPWIKLHVSLLDNEAFECLHNDSKVLLLCLWLFAARKGNGEIPANLTYLQRKLPTGKKANLQPLVDAGFIECYQNDSNLPHIESKYLCAEAEAEAETEGETKAEAETEYMSIFDEARKLFPGTKRGLQTEYSNFTHRCKRPTAGQLPFILAEVLPLLKPAVEAQIAWRQNANGEFRPAWKNFTTWINKRCWEQEMPKNGSSRQAASNKKTKLFPITGKTCSTTDCRLPAVYKDTSGSYDYFCCAKHLPKKVKEMYE